MMKKIVQYIIIVLVIGFLGTAVVACSNPLKQPEEKIKKDMLEITPIGMSMENVILIIEDNENWVIWYVNYEHGYSVNSEGEPTEGIDNTIGNQSIRAHIGVYNYRVIGAAYVVVYYAFDKDSKLIDIAVRKDIDYP